MSVAYIDFCGERYDLAAGGSIVLGREATVSLDDNPYLHRRFLELTQADEVTWLTNLGDRLSATVADGDGLVQAWLSPGGRIPIMFPRTRVWFTAGPTTYEFEILQPDAVFTSALMDKGSNGAGAQTLGSAHFTISQRQLIVALAEPLLRGTGMGTFTVPSSAAAARRLGWPITKFNRKLDNVCAKLTDAGVRGLHGASGQQATQRRTRLVEYAVASRLITVADLELIERPHGGGDVSEEG